MELKEASVTDIIRELHSRGLAVCVFTPEDVITAHCGDARATPRLKKEAADWLVEHAKHVEDAMSEGGWQPINFAPDPIS